MYRNTLNRREQRLKRLLHEQLKSWRKASEGTKERASSRRTWENTETKGDRSWVVTKIRQGGTEQEHRLSLDICEGNSEGTEVGTLSGEWTGVSLCVSLVFVYMCMIVWVFVYCLHRNMCFCVYMYEYVFVCVIHVWFCVLAIYEHVCLCVL